MKSKLMPILIVLLGLGAAVLFCLGMTVEAFACGVVALIVAATSL